MKTATVRELRTSFPRVEAWLREGEDVVITKGGKPVAQLVPPPKSSKPDFAKRFGGVKSSKSKSRFDAAAILHEERGG